MKQATKQRITFQIEADNLRWVDREAKRLHITRSQFIRAALRAVKKEQPASR